MKLKTIITITKPYSGKSKFEFWKNLNVGDELEVSLNFEKPGGFRDRVYATNLKVVNLTTGNIFGTSLTDMVNYFSKIEYVEL